MSGSMLPPDIREQMKQKPAAAPRGGGSGANGAAAPANATSAPPRGRTPGRG